MTLHPDIRDQVYQFFVEEAPELLQLLEAELLTLHQDRSTTKVHHLMRAAHTIKGGASSIGLETIATLAHRLETIFKVLYSKDLEIDLTLQNQLLQAYDCLRLPLIEQITTGTFDAAEAIVTADPVFAEIEAQFGDALIQAEQSYIPSPTDTGIDIVASIFEVDVAAGLKRIATVAAAPSHYPVMGELRAQAEVFAGFAELLNLPGFRAIAEAVQQALTVHPQRVLEIAHLALIDFERGRQAVLAGERTQGGSPSAALLALATQPPDPLPLDSTGSRLKPELRHASPQAHQIPAGFCPPSASDWQPTATDDLDNLDVALQQIEQLFGHPQSMQAGESMQTGLVDVNVTHALIEHSTGYLVPAQPRSAEVIQHQTTALSPLAANPQPSEPEDAVPPNLSVRVDAERLDRMNNLVGDLAINRDGLALQNEQLQGTLRGLLHRFEQFQTIVDRLQDVSDQMLVAPERFPAHASPSRPKPTVDDAQPSVSHLEAEFDPLEMDHYSALHSQLQEIMETIVQLGEAIDDVTLFARQSDQILEKQQYMLAHLRNELTWARMLPLGEVLHRFPRLLHDLSATYHKPVRLQLIGTDVLVDKAILGKLHTPLLHLFRNAFDHGIEPPEIRRQQGKPEVGLIEIRAYQKGNQTLIEVRDDGQGLNLDAIRSRAFELGWLSFDQLAITPVSQLLELIFAPGFSTADQVNELSGRGVGLDVVRSQLQAIKGTVTVTSTSQQGTTFSLQLPLIMTSTKLVICMIGSVPIAIPVDSIEEIVTPQAEQIKQSGNQKFLLWREQIVPAYRLADLLHYRCPLPETISSKALETIAPVPDGIAPMLVIRQEQQVFALEVSRLVAEQDLVIKSFGTAITPPRYLYGCTILGDGSLVPILDSAALLSAELEHPVDNANFIPVLPTIQSPTVLVVDDATTLRRTLALSLERMGCRILQARDGWEAIEQLRNTSAIDLVICDIEMPKINGFEFLSYRRQEPQLANVPVVILTSRSNDKHRWLAMRLGATAYFTKPYLEHEFLTAIQNVMQLKR